ncbi:unnamed protein product [Durusdinium trenchii]|uniref:Uncharacterized protein n=1 Tax=Durusdinium trenchii TaxID=1381693 RepID=A0ABP0MCH4_9DINO
MSSPVVEEWAQSKVLMNRAGMGRLSLVANVKTIDRKDVVSNSDVLIPVIKYLGCRVPVSQIAEHVDMFLNYARPKGDHAKFQAWIIKRLISEFNRSARRGHFPREKGMQDIYTETGMTLPFNPRAWPSSGTFNLFFLARLAKTTWASFVDHCNPKNFSRVEWKILFTHG